MKIFDFIRKNRHQKERESAAMVSRSAIKIKQSDPDRIKCPCCFREFSHRDVHFKVRIYEPERQDSNPDLHSKEDPVYRNFWSYYAYPPNWEYADCPVVKAREAGITGGKLHTDQDGFVEGMTDSLGRRTDIRICPHCHNPLPAGYGKYPIYMIAVTGSSYVGKAVYLSQLMKHMESVMTYGGLRCSPMTEAGIRFIQQHLPEKDTDLRSCWKPYKR